MPQALLVNLPQYDIIAPPAALAILAAVCNENNYDYEFFDFNIHLHQQLTEDELRLLSDWLVGITTNYDDIDSALKTKLADLWCKSLHKEYLDQFDVVAVSVFTVWSLRIAQLVLPELRKMFGGTIVLGGNGCSSKFVDSPEMFADWVTNNRLANFIVRGDGEPTFDAILKGQQDIPGVNGYVQKYDWDIDTYPNPDYSKFDLSLYNSKKVYITGSRGCVRNCTFCDIGVSWPKFRYRKASKLVDEIKKHYYDLGVTSFDFTDSLINGSISNFYEFNVKLAEEKAKNSDLKDVSYIGQFICRPRTDMPRAHYEAMYYAGAQQLTVGIESFSEAVRMHMRKKFSNADIDYHIEQCSYWGIKNVWLMICGYPTETIKDHQDNLDSIHKYRRYAEQGIIELIRWGTTMHLFDDTPIVSPEMIQGLDIQMYGQHDSGFANVYNWISGKNPELDLKERLRRRVEIHEHCVRYGYQQPRVRQELLAIKNLAEQSNSKTSKTKPVIMLKKELA
jgi:hypothetical protein